MDEAAASFERARGREVEANAGLALAEGLARGAAHEPAREAS